MGRWCYKRRSSKKRHPEQVRVFTRRNFSLGSSTIPSTLDLYNSFDCLIDEVEINHSDLNVDVPQVENSDRNKTQPKIINLSKVELNKNEINLLKKGPKFTPTPK